MGTRTLVDTHIALWLSTGSHSISKVAARHLRKSTETYVSSISVAEIEIKKLLKKMPKDTGSLDEFRKAGFEVLSFGFEAAATLSRFVQLVKHDPFDRMILAQAASMNAVFITADQKLIDLELEWVIDARA